MDTGISPAGTMEGDILCCHIGETLLNLTLNSLSIFLFLPTTILCAIVTDGELDGSGWC